MKKGNLVISMVLMVFGILITINSYSLGLGSLDNPDAGLMPFASGIIILFCSIPILVSYLNIKMAGKGEKEGIWAGVDFMKIGLVLASLIGYLVLLEKLGFLVTASLFLLILFKMVGSQKWRWVLIQTVLTLLFVYTIFVILLDVYMPFLPF